ncbi:hypothetical protein AVEN_264511-1 [Araneus ventricosus]|uniref:Uncharacterized protein n=1 Tax=Araneus ventricosus TaxID=182803 RepID=A0A4Y2J7L3_ARAVE|nr:hypothetical protein AVEN_264511-1 [Araneus ventricosus]
MTVAIVFPASCFVRVRATLLNRSRHHPDSRRFTRIDAPQDSPRIFKERGRNKVSRSPVCDGMYCDDGRCVPDYWMCSDGNVDRDSESKKLLWKEGFATVHYAFAGCGIVVIVALLLSCLWNFGSLKIKFGVNVNGLPKTRHTPSAHHRLHPSFIAEDDPHGQLGTSMERGIRFKAPQLHLRRSLL